MLLSFSARNHRSIRDTLTIDFTRKKMPTLVLPEDWRDYISPVAGFFGANASGKTTVLNALCFAFDAIKYSSSQWPNVKSVPWAPFALDPQTRAGSSTYEIEFVFNERRHRYGFEINESGILAEWLRDVPSRSWRTLVDRRREPRTLKFHTSVRTTTELSDFELLLSRAHAVPQSPLFKYADFLISHFDSLLAANQRREARVTALATAVRSGKIPSDDIVDLLRAADVGIRGITIEEEDLLAPLREAMNLEDNESLRESVSPELLARSFLVAQMLFVHEGADEFAELGVDDESDGTLSWLVLASATLNVLRSGGVLAVDEIDTSLHPYLVDLIVKAFLDPMTNIHHAQLLFTSHDTFVLSPLSDAHLDPHQIWITEKNIEGATELIRLSEYAPHAGANLEKRYLSGRYGAIPQTMPTVLTRLTVLEEN